MIYTVKLDIEIDDKCKMEDLSLDEGIKNAIMRETWKITSIGNLDILKIGDEVVKHVLYPPVEIGDTVYFAYIEPLNGEKIIRPWKVEGIAYKNGDWYVIAYDDEEYKVGSEYALLTKKEAEINLDAQYKNFCRKKGEIYRREIEDLNHYVNKVAKKYKVDIDIDAEIAKILAKISEQISKKINEGEGK